MRRQEAGKSAADATEARIPNDFVTRGWLQGAKLCENLPARLSGHECRSADRNEAPGQAQHQVRTSWKRSSPPRMEARVR